MHLFKSYMCTHLNKKKKKNILWMLNVKKEWKERIKTKFCLLKDFSYVAEDINL